MANPNPNSTKITSSNHRSVPSSSTTPPPQPPPFAGDDNANSSFMSRRDVCIRRSARVKRLARLYKAQYWMLTEEVRRKHREYIWLYGKSPFMEEEKANNETDCCMNEADYTKCGTTGCKVKSMAFTKFCHTHILADTEQVLYVRCNYIVNSAHCGKPVIRSTVPPYCSLHFPRAEGMLLRALRKQGVTVSASNKICPQLHLMFKESVSYVQMKRRADKKKVTTVKTERMEVETC